MTEDNEETRFTAAFNAVLERNPDRAPGPTAINRELSREWRNTGLNILNGRMVALRIRLLEEAGFVRSGAVGSRWVKR